MKRDRFPKYGLILQRRLKPSEKPLYELNGYSEYTAPTTAVIPNTDILSISGKKDLLVRSRNCVLVEKDCEDTYFWGKITKNGVVKTDHIHYNSERGAFYGLELPREISAHYKLREGDTVGIYRDIDKKIIYIGSVNGCSDIDKIQSWPFEIFTIPKTHPEKPLPIEKYGNPTLRALTLLAPIGMGSSHWVIAPAHIGKTYVLLKVFEACLKLSSELENLYVIMGFVGDRALDSAEYAKVFDKFKNQGIRGEIHSAPRIVKADYVVELAMFLNERARRLATTRKKDVVLIVDSISRIADIHSQSSYSDSKSGMKRGGLSGSSIQEMIAEYFGVFGNFGTEYGSITLIASALADPSDKSKRTSESAVETETSDSSTTGIWRLDDRASSWPKVNVHTNETYTRYLVDFRSDAQIKEMEKVKKIMRSAGGLDSQHKALLEYVKNNPFPKY